MRLNDFDLLDLTFQLEKRLAIIIPKPGIESLHTIGAFADHIAATINAKCSPICPGAANFSGEPVTRNQPR